MRPRWMCPYCGHMAEPNHSDAISIDSRQSVRSGPYAEVTITYLIKHQCKETTA